MAAVVTRIDPLLDPVAADRFVADAQAFGVYRLYAEHEQIEVPYGVGLLPRHDAVLNFLSTRMHDGASKLDVGARTSYFREEYAYAGQQHLPGVEVLYDHEGFADAARMLHGRPVVEPAIVYANVMLPGQELAVHTDVPEFRGLNRKVVPQWLLVVMHHSGLFTDHRLPIATAIAYFGDAHGGDLRHWPDGIDGPADRVEARHNTAVVLDTDSVFHGVEPVGGASDRLPPLPPGTQLRRTGDRWDLADADGAVAATYDWDELRLSVSWKAYCFADPADRDRWRDHTEDLDVDTVLDTLVADLAERGVESSTDDADLGLRLIETHIRFPVEQ